MQTDKKETETTETQFSNILTVNDSSNLISQFQRNKK
jgi:hypothetical protein